MRQKRMDLISAEDVEDTFVREHENRMQILSRRVFGGKLVRIGTPVEKTNPGDV